MAGAFGRNRKAARTKAVLRSLALHEVPQVTDTESGFPVVLDGAKGARVRDADGNRYIDMTSFFGVGAAGHRNPAVVSAARVACGHLVHSMGDVHPDAHRARLLSGLAALMPAPDYRGLLSLNGSDAVETALKFAAAATGRGGVIAFEGAYHGLTAGALEVTWRDDFREPFAPVLSGRAVFAPWPAADGSDLEDVLGAVESLATEGVTNAFGQDIGHPGALIVEPVQGRGGVRVPPEGFLRGLADICARYGIVFITDEIYCGTWRTGTFLASEPEGVAPDIVCLGKALGGGFPLSVAMMRPAVAESVSRAAGEAVHTSTFLGWPVSCAAGVEVLRFMSGTEPAAMAGRIEEAVSAAVEDWRGRFEFVRGLRGRGAMLGVQIGPSHGRDTPEIGMAVVREALKLGVIVLPEGPGAEVLAVMPPLVISEDDLASALRIIGRAMENVAGTFEDEANQ